MKLFICLLIFEFGHVSAQRKYKEIWDNHTKMLETNDFSDSDREMPTSITFDSLMDNQEDSTKAFGIEILECELAAGNPKWCAAALRHVGLGVKGIGSCDERKGVSKVLEDKPECESTIYDGKLSCQFSDKIFSEDQITAIKRTTLDICKIRSKNRTLIINACEFETEVVSESVTFITKKNVVYPIEGFSIEKWSQRGDINSYDCGGSCEIEACKSGKCSGDEIYCQSLGCHGGSSCFCKYLRISDIVRVRVGSEILEPDCWGVMPAHVTKVIKPELSNNIDNSCHDCKVECEPKGVLVHTPTTVTTYMRICKNPHCMFFETRRKQKSFYELSTQMSSSEGEFTVDFWFPGGTKPYTIRTSCRSFDICETLDCEFCLERLNHYSCFTWVTWILLLIPIVIILIANTLLVKSVISTLRRNGYLTRNWERKIEIQKKDLMKEDKEREDIELVRQRRRAPTPPLFSLALLLVMMSVNVDSCAISSSIIIPSTSCSTSIKGVESCEVTQSVRLIMAAVGQETCYTLLDPTSKSIGIVKVKTLAVDIVCKKNLMYYTPNVIGDCIGNRRCNGAGDCYDNKCSAFKFDERMDVFGEANDKLGFSGCKRSCGCAGCGCFYCSDSCHFYRAYFKNPYSESFEVYKCSEWNYRVKVDVSVIINGETKLKEFRLMPGVMSNMDDIKLTLVSITQAPLSALDSCFMSQGELISMVDCNNQNYAVRGKVGEIQCPTKRDAEKVTKFCIADVGLFQVNEADGYLKCVTNLVNLKQKFSNNLLPRVSGSVSLLPDNGSVIAEVNGEASLEIQMDIRNWRIRAKYDKNTCFVQRSSVSGCYDCNQGAIFSITAHTDFGSALALIKCPDSGLELPLIVNNLVTTANYTVHLQSKNIDENCVISCPNGDTTFKLIGDLKLSISLDLRNESIVGIEVNKRSSLGHGLMEGDWFLPLMGLSGSMVFLLVIVAVLFCFCK